MVPTDAQLPAAPIVMQVVSLGPDGPELTNAIDAVVGAWVPTK